MKSFTFKLITGYTLRQGNYELGGAWGLGFCVKILWRIQLIFKVDKRVGVVAKGNLNKIKYVFQYTKYKKIFFTMRIFYFVNFANH